MKDIVLVWRELRKHAAGGVRGEIARVGLVPAVEVSNRGLLPGNSAYKADRPATV